MGPIQRNKMAIARPHHNHFHQTKCFDSELYYYLLHHEVLHHDVEFALCLVSQCEYIALETGEVMRNYRIT